MELTWIFTVCRLTTSCSAICALVRPAVNRRSTSPSRAVSLAGVADEADIVLHSLTTLPSQSRPLPQLLRLCENTRTRQATAFRLTAWPSPSLLPPPASTVPPADSRTPARTGPTTPIARLRLASALSPLPTPGNREHGYVELPPSLHSASNTPTQIHVSSAASRVGFHRLPSQSFATGSFRPTHQLRPAHFLLQHHIELLPPPKYSHPRIRRAA